MYSESLFNALYVEGQNKRLKIAPFFSQVPTHHSCTFNSQILNELKHNGYLSKSVFEIFPFLILSRFY